MTIFISAFPRLIRCVAYIGLIVLLVTAVDAQTLGVVEFSVQNPLPSARRDAAVTLDAAVVRKAAPGFDGRNFLLLTKEGSGPAGYQQIAAQGDDLNGDGVVDEIAFVIDLAPREKRTLMIAFGEEQQIAPLRRAFQSRSHAAFNKKYEGMGWESDRVAWRIYFDKRNAVDLFGKRKPVLSLDHYATPGVDYHEESPFGRDIYKNGDAIGIGSIAAIVNGKPEKVSDAKDRTWKILADGPVRSIAVLRYDDWKLGDRTVDLVSRLTIWAGQNHFEHHVELTGSDDLRLVTGLPIKPNVERADSFGGGPAYLATWGKQVLKTGATASDALPDHDLGLAIILPGTSAAKAESVPDKANHLVTVPLSKGETARTGRYYVVAVWDQEFVSREGVEPALLIPAAVKSSSAWRGYVESLSRTLNRPVEVSTIRRSRSKITADEIARR
jgi:hypothetical protein